MQFGKDIAARTPSVDGTASCISADFDENDNMLGNQYKLYHTWL